jgi:catechol 1,2-dioxygenase
MPRRPDEAGDPLLFTGRVVSSDGTPLAGAELDVWHADAKGLYSGFDPSLPEGILRGKVYTDDDGRFELRTVVPAPYTVPHDGPTGQMISACGWHPWRPAHIHLLVSADGHQVLTSQLYMEGDQYLDDDVAGAVKPSLIVAPERHEASPERGMPEPYRHFDYEFQLAEAQTPAAVS